MGGRFVYGAIILVLAVAGLSIAQTPIALRDSGQTPPNGYTGALFHLSKDYPTTKPAAGTLPWKAFDFKTQPQQYMQAVLDYCFEGNEDVGWVVQNNAVRKWYHAPGLAMGSNARECISGLTNERKSDPGMLHANQTHGFYNYAVGMYNPIGGYTLGQVWADPANPDITKAHFEDGTVAFKLLYTTAEAGEVPYLANAPTTKAYVKTVKDPTLQVRDVSLLQVDIAVRDTRSTLTGWVFGTFVYHDSAPGTDPWRKLLPVGLMWGDDPTLLIQKQYDNGRRPKQSWIAAPADLPNIGYLGRLNGPVDNPLSSCLSCHAFAGRPDPNQPDLKASNIIDKAWPKETIHNYFRNYKNGAHPVEHVTSLDYSLQLHVGVRNVMPQLDNASRGGEEDDLAMSSAVSAQAALTGLLQADSPASQPSKSDTQPHDSDREGTVAAQPLKFKPPSAETDADFGEADADQPVVPPAPSHTWMLVVIFICALGAALVLIRARSRQKRPV